MKNKKMITNLALVGAGIYLYNKFAKKDEVTEQGTTGIGRAKGMYQIRTKKYGNKYIGFLYMDGKLVYSKGNFATEKDAKKWMLRSKKMMSTSYGQLSTKEKREVARRFNKREAMSPATKKSELFL